MASYTSLSAAVRNGVIIFTPAAAPDPGIVSVDPTSILSGEDANLVITLENMPTGFTLDDVLLGVTSAMASMKNSDTEVTASWMMPALGTYDVTVQYNTTESVTLENALTVNNP